MNKELRAIVVEALGGEIPELNEMWFNVFCIKFANLLFFMIEEELSQ